MAASFSSLLDALSVFLGFRKLIGKGEVDLTVFEFTHRDTRGLGLSDVGIDTCDCTALELFAALRGKDDHSIFRIDLRRIDDLFLFDYFLGFFCDVFDLVGHNLGYSPSNRCLDASKLSRIPFIALVCLSVHCRSAVLIDAN